MPPMIDSLVAKAVLTPELSQTESVSNGKWSQELINTTLNRPNKIKDLNLTLTRYWRRYGVKASFFFTFFLLWNGFNNIMVDQDPGSSSKIYAPIQTFWLTAFRVVTLFIINFTLPGFISLLLYTSPAEEHDDIEEDPKKVINSVRGPLKILLRIVTCGNYPLLVKDNINYHENLFKQYWRNNQDKIEIHISSQTALNLARPRVNSNRCEVKEFDIHPNYRTPNGSLYKARNNTHGLSRCVEEAQKAKEPLDRIWVIQIDEDVFLTRQWLQEFDDTVLSTNYGEYKFVSSPSRPIFLDAGKGMIDNSIIPPIVPFFGEAFRFAMDISRIWWQAKLFGRSFIGPRGSCYAIRLDLEARIGYDCGGPFLSVGDDATFVHQVMAEEDVKLKFLDAWCLEGAPNSALAFMKQRARWVRNNVYTLLFAQVPTMKKLRLASFVIMWTVIMPCGVICLGTGYILMVLNGRVVDFYPAGPAWPLGDAVACLSAACVIYWYIYGCALLLPWYWGVLVSLTFSTYIPVLPLHFIGAVAAIWGLFGALRELGSGLTDFAMTEKKA